jgi:asparagine synthase (glutamine-hydrolysing)
MCGISGAVARDPAVAGAAIMEQLRCQDHRGPDAAGYFDGGHGVIGQNRLSIIDLTEGDPPLTNEDETVGAVLNGEIYNFVSLREELMRSGHQFASRCDTEVIAHLAEECEAVELARRLDGMFAFAVWDKNREQLVLGRDRAGKKPLYYWHGNGVFVFASEIKGVLAHPAVLRELNPRAISAYLTFGYVPTPETFFAGVRSIPPGHVLTVAPGAEPSIRRYWSLEIPSRSGGLLKSARSRLGLEEAAREVRSHLEEAVRRRLMSDVPLGAFLSGGIDSSAIVAVMAHVLGRPVKTFTIGFEDRDGYDERPYAQLVAQRYGTEHHEEVVHPEAVDLVERLVWHHDQPFGDSSAIPTFLLNESARKHVTVALSGDGGDELFAGYERFAAGTAVGWVTRLPGPVRNAGFQMLNALPPTAVGGRAARAQRFVATAELGMPEAYLAWISYVPEVWRRQLLEHPDGWGHEDYRRHWEATAGSPTLDRLLALNFQTYLPDDLLVKADRMSMAHGLEVRSPFLDTDLVRLAMSLAPGLKLQGLSLKRVLKHALRDLLPTEILRRRKRGFGVPLDRWFREDLASYTTAMLGPGARVRNHVNGEALDRLVRSHVAGGAKQGHALWTLLTLEIFLRQQDW